MLIHSITPINMLLPEQNFTEPKYTRQGSGYLELRKNGEYWEIARVISTDPKDYLRAENGLGRRV